MITVRIKRNPSQHIVGFVISGHSGYAARGQDIVCAGISAIVQTTILGLQEVLEIECDGIQKEGRLECNLPSLKGTLRSQADLLLDTMLQGLAAMAAIFSDYVRIIDSWEVL